jgi:hypothetical protein
VGSSGSGQEGKGGGRGKGREMTQTLYAHMKKKDKLHKKALKTLLDDFSL